MALFSVAHTSKSCQICFSLPIDFLVDDSSLRALFQKISPDDTLRRSLLEAPQPAPEGDNEEDESVAAGGDTTAVNRPQPDVEDGSEDTPLVADVHQMGRDASLVVDARQSRGIEGSPTASKSRTPSVKSCLKYEILCCYRDSDSILVLVP